VATIVLRASGTADVDEVWDRYVRPARWPSWSPQIRDVRASADRISAGVEGAVIGFCGIRAQFVVEAVDEPRRRWSWRVRLGPIGLRLEHGVEAAATGSRTTLRIEGPSPVIAGYAPLAQLALHRLVRPSGHPRALPSDDGDG
jgi:hypothetical protein